MLYVYSALPIHICKHRRKVGVLFAALHAGDAVVAAKGEARDTVARTVALETYIGPRHADHELRHAHAKSTSCNKMPQLVDDDDDDEQEQPPKDREQCINQKSLRSSSFSGTAC